MSEKIPIEEWRTHFINLLEGSEERENNQQAVKKQTSEELITQGELERQIRKLKKKKTPGADGIQNEAWIYGGERVRERLKDLMNEVWMGKGFPKQWKEGLVCPVYKKGDKKRAESYRGITLLNTAYKIYAMVVEERVRNEMEEKGMLPDGQAGFRKGRGTMDNVYILNHIVEKQMKTKGGKLYTLFVDLKAAFDNVERERLWEYLRERGLSEHLILSMEEMYAETVNRVTVNGVQSERFWTQKGLRQGCPLSPILFAAYIGDIEEMFRKAQAGGVVVGKEKVWSMAYADDLVMVAREAKEMKGMMKSLERYLRRKKLSMNVEKSKIMVFKKGGGRKKKEEWKWNGQELEEVREYKYLGYWFCGNNNNERVHVREMNRKANAVVGQVWSIGERKFGCEFERRMLLFDVLVKSIMMYGAEIWGWKEQEKLEEVQCKYLKWVLGLERETPWYIVMEETKRDKIRVEAGKRAVKFEERLRERTECKILQECYREKRKDKDINTGKERKKYYERNGYAISEIERMRDEGRMMMNELVERDRDVQKQERRGRIETSRYCGMYKSLMADDIPQYLAGEGKKREHIVIARFRCGNEENGNKYWLKDEMRVCRMCGQGMETIEHLAKECTEMKETDKERNELLNEDGRGLEWIKNVVRMRKKTFE